MIRAKYDVIKKTLGFLCSLCARHYIHMVADSSFTWDLFFFFQKKKKEKRNMAVLKKAGKLKWLINLLYENNKNLKTKFSA